MMKKQHDVKTLRVNTDHARNSVKTLSETNSTDDNVSRHDSKWNVEVEVKKRRKRGRQRNNVKKIRTHKHSSFICTGPVPLELLVQKKTIVQIYCLLCNDWKTADWNENLQCNKVHRIHLQLRSFEAWSFAVHICYTRWNGNSACEHFPSNHFDRNCMLTIWCHLRIYHKEAKKPLELNQFCVPVNWRATAECWVLTIFPFSSPSSSAFFIHE